MSFYFFCFLKCFATFHELCLHILHELLKLAHFLGLLLLILLVCLLFLLVVQFDTLAFLVEFFEKLFYCFLS